MAKSIYIARPRLDCSFKAGPIPDVEGPPRNTALGIFGTFMDSLEAFHLGRGDKVVAERRPLWQFDLPYMQQQAQAHDRVYFPHRLREQFPIGGNAWYFKTTAFAEYLTADPQGWGASLSWLPLKKTPPDEPAWQFFRGLSERIWSNHSIFEQPARSALPAGKADEGYLLFVCQIPHDETLLFHSEVSVAEALASVIAYAEHVGLPLWVKGHPANPKSMQPLRDLARASSAALWVDNASIHDCLAGARRVFLVNSGVGFEAMLHDRTLIHFGHAEYSSVVPRAEPTLASLLALHDYQHDLADYVGFLNSFFARTLRYDLPSSFGSVL
jgi:hypothetical protein